MKRPRHNIMLMAVIIFFVSFCILSIIKLNIGINEKSNEAERLSMSITERKDEIDRYENELSMPMDDEYIKDLARDKLNLRLPEEIIFYNDLID